MSSKFTQAVIKIASRCNLNCSYCYVYNRGDTTYKAQPKFMPKSVVYHTIERIYNHTLKHEIEEFCFIFHGGEPLLAKIAYFEEFLDMIEEKFADSKTKIKYYVQTNGMRINKKWCKLFEKYDFSVGVSLDGTKEANDEFRVDHKGKGSYDRVVKGINYLKNDEWVSERWGIISVVNVNIDPMEVYDHFKDLEAKVINFLLPDCTYNDDHLPAPGETIHADWLIKMFDRWFYEKKEEKPDIQMFSSLISIILGGRSQVEHFGKNKNEIIVIESKGEIEAEDSLRGCGNGFTKTTANVLFDELDGALDANLAYLYHNSSEMTCEKCLACPLNEICSGGFLLHRYSDENGFNNPSVYCNNLIKLITHIQKAVLDELPKELVEEAGISHITYDEVIAEINTNLQHSSAPEYAPFLESFNKTEFLVK